MNKQKQHAATSADQQRRFLLGVPVVILPFLTLLFWLLGGGSTTQTATAAPTSGLNLELPSASEDKDSVLNKMAFYEQAKQDSVKLANNLASDPYLQQITQNRNPVELSSDELNYTGISLPAGGYPPNSREAQMAAKLQQLNSALNTPSSYPQPSGFANGQPINPSGSSSGDIDRLSEMMNAMQNGSAGGDPEMAQLSAMLGQILDIQHPERMQEKLRQTSVKSRGQVFAVTTKKQADQVSLLEAGKKSRSSANGFYALDSQTNPATEQNAIEAIVHENQSIVSGSIIKLRLLTDVYINGNLVPKNTFLFGTATVSGERLLVDLTSIRYQNSIYTVNLVTYGLDGLEGIYIPGAISRDAAKGSADQALSGVSLGANSLDPSLSMQAMGAGLEAAKGLLSKKVKMIRVTVKAGYKVLLRDAKSVKDN